MTKGHRYLLADRPPPRAGSVARRVYDDLLAGRTVDFTGFGNGHSRLKDDLRDYHGFEFEHAGRRAWRATGRYTAGGFVRIWSQL